MERFLRRHTTGGEAPTEAAELSISIAPAGVGRAEPPAIAPAAGGSGDRYKVAADVSRLRAAIEAEAATVLEASAEAIEAELAWFMSRRPGPEAPGFRPWSLPLPGNRLWNHPDDDELTTKANLRIRLVPH